MENSKNNLKYPWSRACIPDNIKEKNELIFQAIDIDNYVGKTPNYINTLYKDYGSIIRLFGITNNGNTIAVNCYGFRPYFYINSPNDFDPNNLELLSNKLNEYLNKDKHDKNLDKFILNINIECKYNIYGYNDKLEKFIKITLSTSDLINSCKSLLDKYFHLWINTNDTNFILQYYEANIDFEIRFLVDLNISGCNWIKLNHYSLLQSNFTTNCQIEIDVSFNHVHALNDENVDIIAPYRILSYDIECSGRIGIFPESKIDPIIQIGNTITTYGDENKLIKVIFTLKSCASIVGAHVISSDTEEELLNKWAEFIIESDPDIITGYNIFNFDTPYIIERATYLKQKNVLYLGRLKNVQSTIKTKSFENRAFGKRENKYVNMPGRLQLDLLQILFREHKLRSYSLNNVCFHFLGEQKEDVHYSIISELQNGDEFTRRRLAVYCLKDSYLPLRLLDKLMIITNHIEMSRVTGVPYNYLLERGQQVKVMSQLLRQCKKDQYIIPTLKQIEIDDDKPGFEGATVIEPIKGFYNHPIATLDFMSLYPSIMISHNLCYSTIINDDKLLNNLKLNYDYIVTPTGHKFVKAHVREGILPKILTNLLDARKYVKELMKSEKDAQKYKVYDGRQLAIKISANSVYGFTGAQKGKLPCLAISGSVTSYGRYMIEKTKEIIEGKYNKNNGYNYNSKVIYGDTDSVMIKFNELDNLDEVIKLAKDAANICTKEFEKPCKLEFEKIYFPYLLISKKKYAGLLYTKNDKYDKIDCKGIETVRRDNCLLVSNLINSCLYKILIERNPDEAKQIALDTISDLLMNKIDLSLLIISKELKKTGNNYLSKQPHSELVARMVKRDPGSAPKLGDRVPFVYIIKGKNEKAYEKAEDPLYVLDHNIPIDVKYYLENQLSKPLIRLFEPILKDKTKQILFQGEHTLNKSTSKSVHGLLGKYTTQKLSCLKCKSTMTSSNNTSLISSSANKSKIVDEHSVPALCENCRSDHIGLYLYQLNILNNIEQNCTTYWTECQRCQGSYIEEIICTNRDCPIFYMRTKAVKEIQNEQNILKRFDYFTSNNSH